MRIEVIIFLAVLVITIAVTAWVVFWKSRKKTDDATFTEKSAVVENPPTDSDTVSIYEYMQGGEKFVCPYCGCENRADAQRCEVCSQALKKGV